MDIANKELGAKIGQKIQPKHMKHYGDEQRSIIRQSSLKSAVELYTSSMNHSYIKNNHTMVRDVLSIAEKFEEWVTR